jgi:hypothetical protein
LAIKKAGCFFRCISAGSPKRDIYYLYSEEEKMSRKILSILISVMLIVLLLPGVASAKGNGPELVLVANGSDKCSAIQLKKLEKMVDKANREIEKAVTKAQRTPEDDVAELLAKIDAIVADLTIYAASVGYAVACEYTEYYIDGQYVLIDPLRVIPL